MFFNEQDLLSGADAPGGIAGTPADRPIRGSNRPADGTTKALAVVLGATEALGRGIVGALVAAHRPVVAVAPDRQALAQLRAAHPDADLTIVAATIAGDADGARLAKTLRELGRPIDAVVVSRSGEAGRGRLLDHPTELLRRTLESELLPQLSAARHLLPLLAEADRAGTYVLVGGPGSELPWAGYGLRSVAAAALRMLARVLHDEARALAVRVQLLTVDTPVCGEKRGPHDCPQWPDAVAVGRRVVELIGRSGAEPARAIVHYEQPNRREALSNDNA